MMRALATTLNKSTNKGASQRRGRTAIHGGVGW